MYPVKFNVICPACHRAELTVYKDGSGHCAACSKAFAWGTFVSDFAVCTACGGAIPEPKVNGFPYKEKIYCRACYCGGRAQVAVCARCGAAAALTWVEAMEDWFCPPCTEALARILGQ